jgi:adenylosuccinate synthase
VGWFDAVATRYGCRLQGATETALTCLDVLSYLPEIPICRSYRLGERTLDDFPTTRHLESARPVYEHLPGWRRPITGARSMSDLPREAADYVRRLEALIGVPIAMVSIGPRREEWIRKS